MTSIGHGAAAWTTIRKLDRSYFARVAGGSQQHPHEMRRHELRVRDTVALDMRERRFGIEPARHHRGPAEHLRTHRPAHRRGVIERCGRVEHAGVIKGEQTRHHLLDAQRRIERITRQRAQDALGLPRRTRGIEHEIALGLDAERFGRLGIDRGGEAAERAECFAGTERQLETRHRRREIERESGEAGRDDQRLGIAVGENIGRLIPAEMPVDRHEAQRRPAAGPSRDIDGRDIFHQQRDTCAFIKRAPQHPRQPHGIRVEHGKIERLAGFRGDHRRFVRWCAQRSGSTRTHSPSGGGSRPPVIANDHNRPLAQTAHRCPKVEPTRWAKSGAIPGLR